MKHLDESMAQAYLAGTLEPTTRDEARSHLEHCEVCTQKLHISMQNSEATGELGASTPDANAEATLQRGSLVGRYVVLEVLGAGGMGEVYTAIDPELDRRVALKLVKTVGSKTALDRQTRLLREAQAMAKLSHPNVVSIFDVGVVEGRVFLAMELVTGTTLTGWLEQAPRSWREVLAIFKQAGTGLSAAHRAGMIHRDFKPDNILIGLDGRVRVSDFGLARASSNESSTPTPTEDPSEAKTGESSSNLLATPMTHGVLGTPGYMAPEQLLGTNTDEKSDQFGFCVSLYRALYREAPFRPGSLPSTIAAITAGDIRPAPEGTLVPPWVRRIVLKGLSAAPQNRFASIDELIAALDADPARARKTWLTVGGIAAVVAALLGGGVAYARHQSRRCLGFEERLATVWDEAKQNQLHLAFGKTAVPFSEDAWASFKSSIDQYASGWVAQKTAACEATWKRGDQSEATLVIRDKCLDERLDELRAVTEAFATADARAVELAPNAATVLTTLYRCADAAELERRAPPPPGIEPVQHSIHQGLAKCATGACADALPQLDQAVTDAKALGFAPLIGEAMIAAVTTRASAGGLEVWRAPLLEVIHQGEIGLDDVLRFEGLLALSTLGATRGGTPSEMLTYARLAEGTVERLTPRSWYRARLERVRGTVNLQAGQLDEALLAFQAGLDAATDERAVRFELNQGLADALAAKGLLARSLEHHAVVSASLKANVGEHHPSLGDDFAKVGDLQLTLGRARQALVSFEASERIAKENGRSITRAAIGRGEALRAIGRFAEADSVLSAVLAHEPNVDAQLALGRSLLDQGRIEEAVVLFQKSVESTRRAEARVRLAGALRLLGRLSDAEWQLKTAVGALDSNRRLLHDAHFELAQTAWAMNQQAQARAWAEKALADVKDLEGPGDDAITEWLTKHPL